MPTREREPHVFHDDELMHVEVKPADAPITTGQLLKWGTVMAAVCTTLVSLVWFCASIKQDQAIIRNQFDDQKVIVSRRLDDLTSRQQNSEKAVEELNRKLDVATAILTRIDQKLNRP